MNDAPPPGYSSLLTPDAIFGIGLAIAASFVVGLNTQVKGWAMITAALSAALLAMVVMPLALKQGYTFSDWLGVVCLVIGGLAATMFTLLAMIGRRVVARGDTIIDRGLDSVVDRIVPPGSGEKKP